MLACYLRRLLCSGGWSVKVLSSQSRISIFWWIVSEVSSFTVTRSYIPMDGQWSFFLHSHTVLYSGGWSVKFLPSQPHGPKFRWMVSEVSSFTVTQSNVSAGPVLIKYSRVSEKSGLQNPAIMLPGPWSEQHLFKCHFIKKEKGGFVGVYMICLVFAQNIDCGAC